MSHDLIAASFTEGFNHPDAKPGDATARLAPVIIAMAQLATKPKRKRARKIRADLGPFETDAVGFDRGNRPIEIVRINAKGITYRLRGLADEYLLPHGVAFQRAIGIKHNIDLGARTGSIKRGTLSGA